MSNLLCQSVAALGKDKDSKQETAKMKTAKSKPRVTKKVGRSGKKKPANNKLRVTKKVPRSGGKKTTKRKRRVTAGEAAAVSAGCGLKSPRTQRRAAFQKALIRIRQCLND